MNFIHLIQNELRKETKKTGIRIVFVAILIIIFMLPFTVNLVQEATFERDTNDLRNNHAQRLALAKSGITDLPQNTTVEQLTYANAIADIEYWKTMVAANMEYMDWRVPLSDKYQSHLYLLMAYELSLDGMPDADIDKYIYNVDLDQLYPFFKMSEVEKKEAIIQQRALVDRTKQILLDSDYQAYLENEIVFFTSILEKTQKDYDNKTLEISEEKWLDDMERLKVDLIVLQFRLENNIPYNRSDWRSTALNTILSVSSEAFRTAMTEDEFNLNAPTMSIMGSFDDYAQSMVNRRKLAQDTININWYNLQADIPPLGSLDDARSLVKQFYPVLIILTGLLAILISGGSVATEFNKGTIRLLLIRPLTRTKVLLSKLSNIFIICFLLFSVGFILLVISSGINANFSDYLIPVTENIKDTVREVGFFGYLFPQMILSLLSVVFISSFAFALSVLSKNVAISIALSMLLYFCALPIPMTLLLNNVPIIMNTFVPNINVALFDLLPSFETTLANVPGSVPINFFGGVQLVILSAVLIIVSCIKFSKSDISN